MIFSMRILCRTLGLLCLLSPAGLRAAGERPDLLLVSIDTLRVDRLGCMGYPLPTSPVLDALAKRGLLFPGAVTPAPLTLPAHATMLTGLEPWEHGVRDNSNFILPPGVPTLAEILRKEGYRTGAFVSAFVLSSQFGLSRGFEVYDEPPLSLLKSSGLAVPERSAEATTAIASRWMVEKDAKPFFAWVHYYDPHQPYDPPPSFRERFKDPYDGEVAYVDAQIGRLLERVPRPERTWVLIVSDHGEGLRDHGESTHGSFLFASTIQVLCLIVPPLGGPAPSVSKATATLADLFPTILAISNTPAPAATKGVDLLSLPAPAGRQCAFETLYPYYHHGLSPLRGITDGRWWYVFGAREELYDLATDGRQASNLAPRDPARTREWRKALQEIFRDEGPVRKGSASPPGTDEDLQSLGYLTGGWTEVPPMSHWKEYPDPKDRLDHLNTWEKAMGLLSVGKNAEARALLEPLRARAPRDPEVRKVLGDLFRRDKDYPRALELYREVLRLNPALQEVRIKTVQVLMRLEAFDEADRELKAYLAAIPNDPVALYYLGLRKAQQGLHREALASFTHARERGYDSPELSWRMSLSHAALDEFDRARSILEEVLRAHPSYAPAHYTLGTCALAQGKPEDAKRHFEKAVALEPGLLPARLDLARTRRTLGDDAAESVELVRTVLASDPANGAAMELLGDLLMDLGRKPEAAAAYRSALKYIRGEDAGKAITSKLAKIR
jgi:arylsulfatase A-like enzyme/tetratricopeptide (TPR) repeat protein